MTTFTDYDLAARTKEVISLLVRKGVEELRPIPRYATVTSLDPLLVTYGDDTTAVPVKSGSILPGAVGQIVRVEGPPGDRYISDVVNAPEGVSTEVNYNGTMTGGSIDTTPPAAVTGLTVQEDFEFENIFLSISWVLQGGLTEYYDIEVAEKLGASTYDLARTARSNTNAARVDNLQPNTEYGVRIRGISRYGIFGPFTAWTDITTTSDGTIPPQVANLTLARGATSLIAYFDPLTYNQAPDVANGNGLYEIQADTANTFNTGNLRTVLTTSSIHAFSDIITSSTWYVRVRAIDTSGNLGTWSATQSLSAGQIITGEIADAAIVNDHIAAAGISAANIKFGTMSGDRITANTLDVNALKASTLSAKTITLGTDGRIKIGNPITDGIYIDDLGMRAYSSGVQTLDIDNTGNITLTATLDAGLVTGSTINTSQLVANAGFYLQASRNDVAYPPEDIPTITMNWLEDADNLASDVIFKAQVVDDQVSNWGGGQYLYFEPEVTGGLVLEGGPSSANAELWIDDEEDYRDILGSWKSYTATYTNLSNGGAGAVNSCRMMRIGRIVHIVWRVILGTGASVSGNLDFDLPADAGVPYEDSPASGTALVNSRWYNVSGVVKNSTASVGLTHSESVNNGRVGASAPEAWASGDAIYLSTTYEAST